MLWLLNNSASIRIGWVLAKTFLITPGVLFSQLVLVIGNHLVRLIQGGRQIRVLLNHVRLNVVATPARILKTQ